MKHPSTLAAAAATGEIRPSRASVSEGALLDAGERLLEEVGFDGLTTTAVAAAAGLSTGTFYAYFADKHALLSALFAARLDDLVLRVAEVLTADNLLDLGLDITLAQAVDLVVEGYRAHGAVLRAALPRVPLREDLRRLYWTRHIHSVDVVERFIRRGAAAGLIRGQHPDVLAHAVVVLTQGLNNPVLLTGDGALAAGVRDELAGALVAMLSPR